MSKEECKCGPHYVPMWVKCILSKKINHCCSDHDGNYDNQMGQRKSDDEFKDCMKKTKPNRRESIRFWAMHRLVRIGGWYSYWIAGKKKL